MCVSASVCVCLTALLVCDLQGKLWDEGSAGNRCRGPAAAKPRSVQFTNSDVFTLDHLKGIIIAQVSNLAEASGVSP